MADNVPVTPGSGASFATDDVSGVHYQRVKISDGTADATNHWEIESDGMGQVRAAPKSTTPVSGNQGPLTISSSSVTLSVPATATHCLITCETADVRFWLDGTAPTSSAGHLMVSGQSMEIPCTTAPKFIRVTSTDAILQVSYFKYV